MWVIHRYSITGERILSAWDAGLSKNPAELSVMAPFMSGQVRWENSIKATMVVWHKKKTSLSEINFVHQEAEQSVGRGRCFPGENAKRTRERQDGRDQDPVWSGRHHHQRQQQEQNGQERWDGTGECWLTAAEFVALFFFVFFLQAQIDHFIYTCCLCRSIMMTRSETV